MQFARVRVGRPAGYYNDDSDDSGAEANLTGSRIVGDATRVRFQGPKPAGYRFRHGVKAHFVHDETSGNRQRASYTVLSVAIKRSRRRLVAQRPVKRPARDATSPGAGKSQG